MIPAAKPFLGVEERQAVERVLLSGDLTQGTEVAAFEHEFGQMLSASVECVAVNSGTSALHLLLLAHGIGVGDEVIVPSFSFAATANAVALTGAKPVFADIDPDSFCLAPIAAESAITERTAAILLVHLYGHPADKEAFTALCRKRGLLLLEDAAQAHGAAVGDARVGTWVDGGAFSFYPTKNMTSGEGGMVTTRDGTVARKVRLLRNQGQERRYQNEVIGFNNRMTDIHASIGRVQLKRLHSWNERRQANAAYFDRHLEGVTIPSVAPETYHVYHQYTIRVTGRSRDSFASSLETIGIGNGVYYPTPIHRLPAFQQTVDLPETELAAAEVLSLPVHPSLSQLDLERIVEAVNTLVSSGS